jgi:adenosylcobinamide-phosphate synthase
MALTIFHPNGLILALAVLLDFLFGDPVYPFHPIRLMGRSLAWIERILRRIGGDGYVGGVFLFLFLSLVWVGGSAGLLFLLNRWKVAAFLFHLFMAYSCLALHDLLRHVWAVEVAAHKGDLDGARTAVSRLVGRDIDKMDLAACRRAAIESLSENLTDGFISPLAWYVFLGLPGLVLFKVVSTMDSMVGYKTPRYLRFGWCGARLDDVMNFIPAPFTWLLLSFLCLFVPRTCARKAIRIGWRQHAVLPGPNSGWSEAATAGAIERRLLGPIWAKGVLVTDIWLGEPSDPIAGDDSDVRRAAVLLGATGVFCACLAVAISCLRA